MRKRVLGGIVVLGIAMVVSSGCAKKEVVKPEETLPSTQAVTPPATPETRATQRPAPETGTQGQIAATPAGETPVQQETPREGAAGTATPGTQGTLGEVLQKIYFSFDSAGLSDEARATLSKNAEQLNKQPSASVRIEGNCDERGSDEYNLALGERRANSAKDYLVNLGIKPERISVISYGEEKPADPGHDEAAWAKNRRDEFVIVK